MRMSPIDKRFKLYKSGQASFLCLFTANEFWRADKIMTKAFGMGQCFNPGRYRKYEQVPNKRDWFYSFKASNAIDRPMRDFKIYFRREEQASYLLLAMSNIDSAGNDKC